MANGGVHESIDRREWKVVFWAGFVQIYEVNAHPPLSACFLYHNHIRQPLGIMYFTNEVSFQKLEVSCFAAANLLESSFLFFCLTGQTSGLIFKE